MTAGWEEEQKLCPLQGQMWSPREGHTPAKGQVPSSGLCTLDTSLSHKDLISRSYLCLAHPGYTACFSKLACALDDCNLLGRWTLACHYRRGFRPFPFTFKQRTISSEVPCFPGMAFPWHPDAFLLFWLAQSRFGKGLRIPFAAWNPAFQVRVPGLGELGLVCLLAAQWVCTRPPFGYLTNTGSPKGFWQSWQSFFSESRTALPFSFILSYI